MLISYTRSKICDYLFFEDEKWNNVLNGKILNLLDSKKIPVNFLNEKYNRNFYKDVKFKKLNKNLLIKLRNYFSNFYKKLSRILVRKEDAFLINTFFPIKRGGKNRIILKQWPNYGVKQNYV